MKILHIVPGLNDPTNGIAVAAKWIAEGQAKAGAEVEVVETGEFVSSSVQPSTFNLQPLSAYAEIWVHSMWLPQTMRACWKVLSAKKLNRLSPPPPNISTSSPALVRMPHGCLDPVKVRYHWWKKMLVWPIEKFLFRRADRVVATEAEEVQWIGCFVRGRASGVPRPTVQLLDLGSTVGYSPREGLGHLKFLFVGRMHPLKGVDVLITAVQQLKAEGRLPTDFSLRIIGKDEKEMRSCLETEVVKHGLPIRFLGEVDEQTKRSEMSAADCLVLPTLSENFGLVVKESLELGVPVITTDGAKIWKNHAGVTYLDGFVAATVEERVKLLKDALGKMNLV